MLLLRSLATLALAMAAVAPARAQAPALSVTAVRFYRPDTKQTRVRAFVQVPYALLTPAGSRVSYTVRLKVSDSTGLALVTNDWSSHAQVVGRNETGASALEMVEFAVTPGSYRLDVAVQDSTSGRQASTSATVAGYSDDPGASDLLLSPSMRIADANDSVPRAGELRRGNTLITAVAHLRLTPLRPALYYLLEAYNPGSAEAKGTMAVAIADSTGRALVKTAPAPVTVQPGGGVLRGQLDLAGLPPGHYTMKTSVALGSKTIERSADFTMAELQATLARDTVRLASERLTDEGFFAQLDEAKLDQYFEPLGYLASRSELRAYSKAMAPAAKRRFLAEFWKQHHFPEGSVRNEFREGFYQRIDYANRYFVEKGRGQQPGWKSDRGRIFARNGAPTDSLARQQEGQAPRYTAWKYAKGKGRYYVFVDRTGIGNWVLVATNDLKENSLPGWEEILTNQGVTDIARFVGNDFRTTSSPAQGPN